MQLIIWDLPEPPGKLDGLIILWRSYRDVSSDAFISLPQYIDEHKNELRNQFLSVIYELGEYKLNGKRIIDHLEIREGFSFWWMTLLTENNYGKSTYFYDVIKSIAFDEIFKSITFSIDSIKVYTKDKKLYKVFYEFAKKESLQFFSCFNYGLAINIKRIFKSLPSLFRSMVLLIKYSFTRITLFRKKLEFSFDNDIFFLDYLFHIPDGSLKENKFESNFWGALLKLLREKGTKTNWLHIYVPHTKIKNIDHANRVIDSFDKFHKDERHLLLENFISIKVITNVIKDLVFLYRKFRSLKNIRNAIHLTNRKLNIWFFIKDAWNESLIGPYAVINLFFLNVFEVIFSKIPHQKKGIFLQENQGWEFAFIYFWKKGNHETLIGVPHSTVRFWDLRYFFDKRSYCEGKNCLPLPDFVALNGEYAVNQYKQGNYPKDKCITIEALRYLNLSNKNNQKVEEIALYDILVVGDFLKELTDKQMKLLESASLNNYKIIVKSHPACPIRKKDFPMVSFQLTEEPLEKIFPKVKIVYSSNVTSGAVDAYCFGLPIISFLDSETLNMSPLLDLEGVVFVSNAKDLKEKVEKFIKEQISIADIKTRKTYFNLNENLEGWRRQALDG
ncbi:MAG: hypothetical protein H6630_01280 [Arcobacter sp.]|nr:hypothetical protein [Arcobacter sp.]